MNKQIKQIGVFTINYVKDDLINWDEKCFILKNGKIYGVVYKDGRIEKRKNDLNTGLNIRVSNKLYWRLREIREKTTDKRFIELYDNYLNGSHYYNTLVLYFPPMYRKQ